MLRTPGRTLVPRPLGRCLILALAVLFAAVPYAAASDSIPLGQKSAAAKGAFSLAAPSVDALAPGDAFPPGFTDTPVFTGLTNPTAIRFAGDGRIFIAEKGG